MSEQGVNHSVSLRSDSPTAGAELATLGVPAAADGPEAGPFREFDRESWSRFRGANPCPVSESELDELRSLGDFVDIDEVKDVYLPLSELLRLHAVAAWQLRAALEAHLGEGDSGVPFVIAIAGGVAVGKSTLSRLLRLLIAHWPERPSVELVTTDGFLRPTAELEREGLMSRKGFPESYDNKALLHFMRQVKAGVPRIEVPVYSHLSYDIVPGRTQTVRRPDVLLVEGLNVLQLSARTRASVPQPAVSDFFDLSLYLDACNEDIRRWYVERFITLRDTVFRSPHSYFSHYAELSDERARARAHEIYTQINEVNLVQNIEPALQRADIVLHKRADHRVAWARTRKR